MTWRQILRAHQGHRVEPADAGTSATADVLLQVVLPIVLILAFFALQSAQSFEHRIKEARTGAEADKKLREKAAKLAEKEAALAAQLAKNEARAQAIDAAAEKLGAQEAELDEQVRELTEWWQGISGSEKGELAQELSQALLEIQKQRIVAALEKVEAEYRQELGLSFLLHKEIRLTAEGRLVGDHELFQQACKATRRAFSEESRAGEQAKLYRRVLQAAGLADDGAAGSQAPIPGARATADSLRARNGWISEENRRFLQQRLAQILADLHREVLRLGRRVIAAALEHYRNAPLDDLYRRSPEILKLKQAIVRAGGTGDTTPYEEALLRRLYQQIRVDFDEQGYELLPEAWGSV